MFPSLWTRRSAPWVALGVSAALVWVALSVVDLSPRVEGDFFFAEDDPQRRASAEIAETFPSAPQVILRVGGDGPDYEDLVADLTETLRGVPGVVTVYSITTDDPRRSPLFRRVLLTGEEGATNIILQTDGTDGEVLLPRLEEAVVPAREAGLDVILSGEPVIVELIRRSLFRDLVVFGLAAFLVFGALVTLVYRDVGIMVGTLATSVASVAVTLLLTQTMGVAIGLLTANLITIVFVLTLSHVVFLTANWRRAAAAGAGGGTMGHAWRPEAVRVGVRDTLEGSFWSMATTFLGFSSLLVASAQPLRELGIAGAVGTLVAMAAAYLLYPLFLARWASPAPGRAAGPVPDAGAGGPEASAAVAPPPDVRRIFILVGGVIILGAGLFTLDTDPTLLSYFKAGTELRDGLERIDGDGGSSGLSVVIRDAQGGRLDSPAVYERMSAFQEALEGDTAVGVVLSPAVLLDHARAQPLARFLTLEILLDLAMSPQMDEAGRAFVTPDRMRGLYTLRMRESVHVETREETKERVLAAAREAGLEPVQVGGLYQLQAELGRLIAASLRIGIGGLLGLFLLVGLVVSRSWSASLLMLACLSGVPMVVLGTFGHAGVAVDIITSPAANVALAMGVDSMIHLVVRVRRMAPEGTGVWAGWPVWSRALREIRPPVLVASGVICAGFGIFVLSAFPPTQRFGVAVMLGTVTSATMALLILPGIAALRRTSGR